VNCWTCYVVEIGGGVGERGRGRGIDFRLFTFSLYNTRLPLYIINLRIRSDLTTIDIVVFPPPLHSCSWSCS